MTEFGKGEKCSVGYLGRRWSEEVAEIRIKRGSRPNVRG